MVVTRNSGVFGGASTVVALVVVPFIIFPGTFSVVVIWTVDVEAIAVPGVLLKVVLLLGGVTIPVRNFYSYGSLWC